MSDRAIDEDLIERAHWAHIQSGVELARIALGGEVEEEDGLVMLSTGAAAYQLNSATITKPPKDPLAALNSVRRFFAGRNADWRLWTWGDAAEAVARAAGEAGFYSRGLEPGMMLTPLPERMPDAPAGVTLETVTTPEGLETFQGAFAGIYSIPITSVARVFNGGLLDQPDATVLVARFDGAPAGMALVFTIEGISYMMTSGTLPHFRRRGIGAFLAWSAALNRREECDAAYVVPAGGFPIYEDIGFRYVADYKLWSL